MLKLIGQMHSRVALMGQCNIMATIIVVVILLVVQLETKPQL